MHVHEGYLIFKLSAAYHGLSSVINRHNSSRGCSSRPDSEMRRQIDSGSAGTKCPESTTRSPLHFDFKVTEDTRIRAQMYVCWTGNEHMPALVCVLTQLLPYLQV